MGLCGNVVPKAFQLIRLYKSINEALKLFPIKFYPQNSKNLRKLLNILVSGWTHLQHTIKKSSPTELRAPFYC